MYSQVLQDMRVKCECKCETERERVYVCGVAKWKEGGLSFVGNSTAKKEKSVGEICSWFLALV